MHASKITEALSFDDVLIVPQFSEIKSRAEVDLSVKLSKGFEFKIPITPANMKTIVNFEVAESFYQLGGLCLLHRFCSFEEQMSIIEKLKHRRNDVLQYVGVSVGVKEEDYTNIDWFYKLGVRIVCVDIAHGDSLNCIQMTRHVADKYPDVFLVAGNVATGMGAYRLWKAGADAVKVGIGPGSICTTRTTTGCGVPQLSALLDVSLYQPTFKNKYVIADGGCKKVGDLVKSLALSDIVMTGNMFAGATETPGDAVEVNGKVYKRYCGSSTHRGGDYIEGVSALVESKPNISTIVKTMLEGIASGCSYTGSKNLKELKDNTNFVKITSAGLKENGAHDVVVPK